MGRWGSLEVLEGLELVEADAERKASRRDDVEHVRQRWDLLTREDRLLLKMHLEARSSLDEIAHVTGMDRSTVCRRIHRMIQRLRDETYARCACDRASFSVAELEVIRDRFVRGLSVTRISRDHHLCGYRVRAILCKARQRAGGAGAKTSQEQSSKHKIVIRNESNHQHQGTAKGEDGWPSMKSRGNSPGGDR